MVKDDKGRGRMVRALFDSGCSRSIILKKFTCKSKRTKLEEKDQVHYETYGGHFTSTAVASVALKFIEFNKYREKLINYNFQVDEYNRSKDSKYDMIIGADLMSDIGIDLLFTEGKIRMGTSPDEHDYILMKDVGTLSDHDTCNIIYDMHTSSVILREEEDRQSRILDADYSKVDIDAMVNNLDIRRDTKRKLTQTLKKFGTLFGGGLGKVDMKSIDIELKEGTTPYAGRYYNVPKAYEQPLKKEVIRMCDADILVKLTHDNDSPWASPSFIQPKKSKDIRFLTDFREINKRVIRKPFPLPRIMESLQKIEKFTCATAIDLSQGYYHIPLSKKAQKICTTILPWGKYSYKRLPMGLASAPDIFQSIMMDLLGDLDYVLVYIDDILILQREGETEEDHLSKLETVLSRLENKGFRANLRKTFFMQKELEYLGYLLTDEGVKPQEKKVEAMRRIKPPTNSKQLKRFLGMVNFYRDVWKSRSHILAPLNKLSSKTGKLNWRWGKEQQTAFETAKEMLAKEALLSYPDFSKPFDLYTDASDKQLGATLVQKGRPLGFYTRKLNDAQLNYTVGEKELLGIVEGFKAFEGILRGMKVTVHTDHLNLLYQKLPSQRMVRWRLLLEEFHPQFKHVAGIDNDAADALSRLDLIDKSSDTINWEPKLPKMKYIDNTKNIIFCKCMNTLDFEEDVDNERRDILNTVSDATSYIADAYNYEFALDVKMFQEHQKNDKRIIKQAELALNNKTSIISLKEVEGVDLVHKNNKIIVPDTLKDRVMDWYHDVLVHPGMTRMEASISSVYTWVGLRKDVEHYCKTCDVCQRTKRSRNKIKYGLLPEKEGEITKWSRVNVDLWGPKSIKNKNGFTYEIHIMTMVDPVTGWFEQQQLYGTPTAYRCQEILDNVWLARYPRPREIGFDNGGEFKAEFRVLCNNMGMKAKTSLPWNPQSNAILERIHQVLQDALTSADLDNMDIEDDNEDPFDECLTKASYAIRSAFHATHGYSPAQLVFGRDMFMPVEANVDWDSIKQRKQRAIHKSNVRENSSRINHTYNAGDWILIKKPGIIRKLSIPYFGPYKVVRHNKENGTITYEKEPFNNQNVNSRRAKPYHWKNAPPGNAPPAL